MKSKVLILAVVGIGAYLLMTKTASAGTPTISGPYRTSIVPNAANTPMTQKDAMQNGVLYSVGRFINGIFGGPSASSGGTPSGAGYYTPGTYSVDPNSWGPQAPTYYTPGTYSVDPNSWGPPSPPPDAFPTNPPGGYETSNSFLYSDAGYGSWG